MFSIDKEIFLIELTIRIKERLQTFNIFQNIFMVVEFYKIFRDILLSFNDNNLKKN